MNRKLKFRIWDKQDKFWLENSASFHCFSKGEFHLLQLDALVERFNNDNNN
jgi:hypothetical protein